MADLYVHLPPRPLDEHLFDARTQGRASPFVSALRGEIKNHAHPETLDHSFTTLYLGGGPLPIDVLPPLLDRLTNHLHISAIEEATLDLNPADASQSYLKGLSQLGITRLSIEALSFVPDDLTALDAPHSAEEAIQAVQQARAAGIQSFSVDLLFGGSKHPLSHWKDSLHRAVDLGIPHVTLHEHPAPNEANSDEGERAERLAFAMTFLRAKGYEQYELTHFARPGHRSLYQENYYAHGNVLGLGPSAESFWWPRRFENTTARRWSNVTDVGAYIEALRQGKAPVASRETLDRLELAREYILLRLRTLDGLNLDVLHTQYGVNLRSRFESLLTRLVAEGLIHDDSNRVRLTDRGRLLTDAITQRLLPS